MAAYDKLKAYVGASDADNAFVSDCYDEAHLLVDRYIGTATVPAAIISRAKEEVGSELFHRRSAPNGIAQFATLDGSSAVRVARDPMTPAYAILNRWMPSGGLGIA
jgi:hypothetical protein